MADNETVVQWPTESYRRSDHLFDANVTQKYKNCYYFPNKYRTRKATPHKSRYHARRG